MPRWDEGSSGSRRPISRDSGGAHAAVVLLPQGEKGSRKSPRPWPSALPPLWVRAITDRTMLHISTRGEAPALPFIDALMTGLAGDGGLYWPETFPVLTPDEIAALAGKTYPAAAEDILSRLAGGGFEPAAIRRMIEGAYSTFRHPATCPLVQLGDNLFVLELFHGPTLAFKDVAMQLLGRLMDHVLEQRGERATIVGATSGDTGSAAVAAFECRRLHHVSARARVGRAAPADDDGRRAERPRARDRGLVRRLPGDREGALRPPGLQKRDAPVGREFHQLGARRCAGRLLLHRRRRSGRAAPEDRVLRADRQFRRHPRRLGRGPDGPADRRPHHRDERQRHPRARARDRALRGDGRRADVLALHGHPGLLEFRAPSLRGGRTRPRRGPDHDGLAPAIGRLHHRAADPGAHPPGFRRAGHRRGRRRQRDRPHLARGRLSTAHPAKFPDAVEKASGIRPGLPPHMADLFERKERFTVLPNDADAVAAYLQREARAVRGAAA